MCCGVTTPFHPVSKFTQFRVFHVQGSVSIVINLCLSIRLGMVGHAHFEFLSHLTRIEFFKFANKYRISIGDGTLGVSM